MIDPLQINFRPHIANPQCSIGFYVNAIVFWKDAMTDVKTATIFSTSWLIAVVEVVDTGCRNIAATYVEKNTATGVTMISV